MSRGKKTADSRRRNILQLFEKGMSKVDIAREMKCHVNTIFRILKDNAAKEKAANKKQWAKTAIAVIKKLNEKLKEVKP